MLLVALLAVAVGAVPFRRSQDGCSGRAGRELWVRLPSFGELGTEVSDRGTVAVRQQRVWSDPKGGIVQWHADATSTLVSFGEASAAVSIDERSAGNGIASGAVLEIDELSAVRLNMGPNGADGVFEMPLAAFPAARSTAAVTDWRIIDHGACSVTVPWANPPAGAPAALFGSVTANLNVGLALDQTLPLGDGLYAQLCHLGISMRAVFEDLQCGPGDYTETRQCTAQNDRISTLIGISGAFVHRFAQTGGYDAGAGFRGLVRFDIRPQVYPSSPFADRIRFVPEGMDALEMYHHDLSRFGLVESGPEVFALEGSSAPITGWILSAVVPGILDSAVRGAVATRLRDIERNLSCALSVPMIRPSQLATNLRSLSVITQTLLRQSCQMTVSTTACSPMNPTGCVQTCDVTQPNACAAMQTQYAAIMLARGSVPDSAAPFYLQFARYLQSTPGAFECRLANIGTNGMVPSGTPSICALRLPASRAQLTPSGVSVILAENLASSGGPPSDPYLLLQALGEVAQIPLCAQPRPPSALPVGTNARQLVGASPSARTLGDIATGAYGDFGFPGSNYDCRLRPEHVERLTICHEPGINTGAYRSMVYERRLDESCDSLSGCPSCQTCMANRCATQLGPTCTARWEQFRANWLQTGDNGRPPAFYPVQRNCLGEQEAIGEDCHAAFRAWERCRAQNCATLCQ